MAKCRVSPRGSIGLPDPRYVLTTTASAARGLSDLDCIDTELPRCGL